jgi:hypothetical protein
VTDRNLKRFVVRSYPADHVTSGQCRCVLGNIRGSRITTFGKAQRGLSKSIQCPGDRSVKSPRALTNAMATKSAPRRRRLELPTIVSPIRHKPRGQRRRQPPDSGSGRGCVRCAAFLAIPSQHQPLAVCPSAPSRAWPRPCTGDQVHSSATWPDRGQVRSGRVRSALGCALLGMGPSSVILA